MKRFTHMFACGAALLAIGAQGFAITIDITAPTISFTGTDASGTIQPAIDAYMGSAINTNIADLETKANSTLSTYGDQNDLATGFANANAYSAQAATMQGFQGYKTFALMSGLMIGAQMPSLDPNVISDIPNQVADDPDLYAGLAPAVSFVNLGLNVGKVVGIFNKDSGEKLQKWYANVKFGTVTYTQSMDDGDLDFASTNFGVGVNYQWVNPSKSVWFGLFKWRGVNLGSGLNIQSTSVSFTSKIDPITQPIDDGGSGDITGNIVVTPNIDLGLDMLTFSIPLEATTSVQLLWLANVNFGLGADLVFGSSDITAKASSDVTVTNLKYDDGSNTATASDFSVAPGTLTLDAGTDGGRPSLARLRVMTGLGLNFGPVKIDIPIYYYLLSGLAFGVSAGIVW